MRIMIVDDHEVVREGLREILAADPRFDIVGTAGTGRDALRLARQALPDVALVDLRLPDMRGEDLTRALTRDFLNTAVIILTTYLSEETVRRALDAGASAYVTKAAGLAELRAAIDRVATGAGAPTAPQIVGQLHDLTTSRARATVPTPQQRCVLELAAEGLTNQEIGDRLFISESTVRFHLQKMKAKLAARSKTELIAKAIRAGLIAPAGDAELVGPEA
jgi:DNA-binding NarL/FixJ family response regulator